jgi:hypothetical protein
MRLDPVGSGSIRAILPASRIAVSLGRDTGRAMSQENVEIVRRLYADPRGLTAAASDKVAPDAEFDFSEDVDALRRLHPDNPRLQQFTEGDRSTRICADDHGLLWIRAPETPLVPTEKRRWPGGMAAGSWAGDVAGERGGGGTVVGDASCEPSDCSHVGVATPATPRLRKASRRSR